MTKWIAAAVGAAALATFFTWVLFVPAADWLARHDIGNSTGASLETARNNARGNLLALTAGIAGFGALLFTASNFALQRRTYALAEQGQVTDRYTKAIDQLGSEKLAIRIGGIYALERIARDSARDYPSVMEVLTAFIREHIPAGETSAEESAVSGVRAQADLQVALSVIGRRKSQGERIRLTGADLTGVDLAGVDLTSFDLTSAKLTGAKLSSADLTSAKLMSADLTSAKLDSAKLIGAILGKADLSNARLTGADLTRANLMGVEMRSAFLFGAKLKGAALVSANLADANLTGADLDDAHLNGADLTSAKLGSAQLRGAELVRAILTDADLTHANLGGSILLRANLTGADLTGADLTGADLRGTILLRAILTGADLTGAFVAESFDELSERSADKFPVLPGWRVRDDYRIERNPVGEDG